MPLSEFSLIDRFFKREDRDEGFPVPLGIGDDCALISPPADSCVAISTDTLVEGVHFLPDTDPASLGHKALAVNLSDLAAMGATPAWATLALTLPDAEEQWLESFRRGFFSLADAHRLQLVGGDTTRGPLAVNVTVLGLLPVQGALKRSGARPGDQIYVTGRLGDAGLGLLLARGEQSKFVNEAALARYLTPTPRVGVGQLLLPFASACIDVSDGLIADLQHVLGASGAGARVQMEMVPVSATVQAFMEAHQRSEFAISAGDDYELCFTVAQAKQAACLAALSKQEVPVTRIGSIEAGNKLRLLDAKGQAFNWAAGGYQHQWERP